MEHGIGGGDGQGGGSDVRVVNDGREDTVSVSSGRCTKGLKGVIGKKGPSKRVNMTSVIRGRREVMARVVPAGPIEEREAATIETSDKREELGEGPTRKLELAKYSIVGDRIKGVGNVRLKHSLVGKEVKGRLKRMNHCHSIGGGDDAVLVGDKIVVEGRTQLDAHNTNDKAVQDLADGDSSNAASRLS